MYTIDFVACDLASLDSVKSASRRILSIAQPIDVLICNAGIMALPPGLTKDGYELQFGTNPVGHALLVQLFLPVLGRAEGGRVITLTSTGFKLAPSDGIQFDTL